MKAKNRPPFWHRTTNVLHKHAPTCTWAKMLTHLSPKKTCCCTWQTELAYLGGIHPRGPSISVQVKVKLQMKIYLYKPLPSILFLLRHFHKLGAVAYEDRSTLYLSRNALAWGHKAGACWVHPFPSRCQALCHSGRNMRRWPLLKQSTSLPVSI